MEQKTAAELTAELSTDPSFVEATIGLDTGRLLKSSTHVYFIAPRMGGWEVVEESALSDVSKVEKKSNFIGDTFVIHTKSGRWMCKQIPENVDLRHWIIQKARTVQSQPIRSNKSLESSSISSPTNATSTGTSEWDSSSTSQTRTAPKDAFFSKPESAVPESTVSSTSKWSGQSQQSDFSGGQEDLSSELQSILTQSTTTPTPPVNRNQDVDALLEKMASTEEAESGSSCGGTFVKLFIFIWLFGMFADFCN